MMAEWIDVNNRQPENFASVLCYCRNTSTGGKCATIGSYDKGCWFLQYQVGGQSYPHHYYEVTHWMPLPKPPVPSLKFCPVCGFVAVYDEYLQDGIRVRCTHCGHKTDFYSNKIEAAEDWNTRTPKERGGEK